MYGLGSSSAESGLRDVTNGGTRRPVPAGKIKFNFLTINFSIQYTASRSLPFIRRLMRIKHALERGIFKYFLGAVGPQEVDGTPDSTIP